MATQVSNKYTVLGFSANPQFKKYVLWSLKLLQDIPTIFTIVKYTDDLSFEKKLNTYDIIISDSETHIDKTKLKPNCIVAYLHSKRNHTNPF